MLSPMVIEDWYQEISDWPVKLQADEWFFAKLRECFVSGLSSAEAWSSLTSVGLKILEELDPFIRGELGTLLLTLSRRGETTQLPVPLESKFELIIRSLLDSDPRTGYELRQWFRR